MKITFRTLLGVPNGCSPRFTRFISMATRFRHYLPSIYRSKRSHLPSSLSLSPSLQIALTHALRDNLAVDRFRYFAISTGVDHLFSTLPTPLMRRDAYLDRIEHIAAKTSPITHQAQAVLPPSLSDSPIPEWSRDNRSSEVVYLSPCIQTDRPIVAPVCT